MARNGDVMETTALTLFCLPPKSQVVIPQFIAGAVSSILFLGQADDLRLLMIHGKRAFFAMAWM